ncbi:MAG: DUF835 domain-containing protein [Candidatus Thermoplasmatota archaeon]
MDIYTISCTIAGLISFGIVVILAVYVLKANPKSRINRTFSFTAFSGAIWCLGKSLGGFWLNTSLGFIWKEFGEVGLIFTLPLLVHFSYIFPRGKTLKKIYLLPLYSPSLVFLCIICVELYLQEMILLNSLRVPYSLYQIICYSLTIFNLTISFFKSEYAIERRQVGLVLLGVIIPIGTLFFAVCLSVLTRRGIELPVILLLMTLITPTTLGVICYTISKYKLFLIKPIEENYLETLPKYELMPKASYLVKEEKSALSFAIFVDQVTHGVEGLCISRQHPDLIKGKYGLVKTPKLWLTMEIAEKGLSPTNLSLLTLTIRDFTDKTENGIILIDGIGYLLLHNSFESIVRTLESIKDLIMRSKARLLLPINPNEFSAKEFAIISMDFEEVKMMPT